MADMDLFGFLTENNIDTFFKTFMLTLIGAYIYDLNKTFHNDIEINLGKIASSSLLISIFLVLWYRYKQFKSNEVYYGMCLIFGVSYNTISKFIFGLPEGLDDVINDKGFLKKLIKGFLNKWLNMDE